MAEKKAILVLNASADSLKKAALLPNADCAGLAEAAEALGAVKVDAEGIAAALEASAETVFVMAEGEAALAAALEAADRPPPIGGTGPLGAPFQGPAINGKAGSVDRTVKAEDIAVTIATVADLPVSEACTGAIIYQVMKNPNLKLDEIKKLKEAIARMESAIQRGNREPWDNTDCP